MEEKTKKFIDDNRLLEAGDRVLLGVSGGADSLALFYFLKKYARPWGLTLGVAHLHHGLRGAAADSDCAFVKELCEAWAVPFYVTYEDITGLAKAEKKSVEEMGRIARYGFFKRLMAEKGYNKLALGHHLDDQAETVLMRLIRGTGVKGAAGIAAADTTRGIIRPLLGVSKGEILAYCEAKGLAYCTDATNFEAEATRNHLRLNILPELEKVNPGVSRHLAEFATLAGEYEAFLDTYVAAFYNQVVTEEGEGAAINRDGFLSETPLVQKALLRKAIKKVKGSLKEVEYNHIHAAQRLLCGDKTVWELPLPGRVLLKRRYDRVTLCKERVQAERKLGCYPLEINKVYYFPEVDLRVETRLIYQQEINFIKESKNHCEKIFDYGRIRGRLYLRGRKNGDRIALPGMKGSKKVKDFFIDRKVDRDERDFIPLLSSDTDILWIMGYAVNRTFLADTDSQQLLVVNFEKYSGENGEN